ASIRHNGCVRFQMLLALGAISVVACAETVPVRAPPRPARTPTAPLAVRATTPVRAELPGGGRELFPAHRLVGFCGTPGAPALGKLFGDLGKRSKALQTYAEKYAQGRSVLPVFELIAVIVQGVPGKDGLYRRRVDDHVVDEYLAAARD